jgi:hypothetical protein
LTGVLTIGYRHMLPAVPFAVLVAGNAADWLQVGSRRWIPATAGVVLVGWLAIGTLVLFPHQEAHFNVLAGPWQNWSNILVDSNLDWGQDLPALREVMEERGIESVNLAYFGKSVPETYGVHYRPLPGYLRFMQGREVAAYNPYTPPPGWYAISATSLRLGTLQEDTTDLYAVFRGMQPVDRAGYSIYLYKVEEDAGGEVVRPVVVDTPVYQVPAAELGIEPQVRGAVKWLQNGGSTVYPQGQGFVVPDSPTYHPIGADLGGAFTLLGYSLDSETVAPGQSTGIMLYWQVGDKPMPQPAPTGGEPVSAFVHVVDGDPAKQVAQADGWEVALAPLEPADVISQQFTLDFGADVAAKEYQLLGGLYSPQDGARLPVSQPGQQPADHVVLGTIQVTDK